MKDREKEWHNKLYQENLGSRSKIMPYYEVARRARRDFYNLLLQFARPGLKVLDYGCGTGELAISVAEMGAQVIGIDISSEAIRKANEQAKQQGIAQMVTFIEMDAENLWFPNNTFDVVYGVSILHHLDLRQAYREVARVLKPSGQAIFLEPLGHNPVINWFRSRTPGLRSPDEHPLLKKNIELAAHWFGEVECRYYALLSLLAIPLLGTPPRRILITVLESVDRVILKNALIGKYAWQVVLAFRAPYETR